MTTIEMTIIIPENRHINLEFELPESIPTG
jgi:hypothetical protein